MGPQGLHADRTDHHHRHHRRLGRGGDSKFISLSADAEKGVAAGVAGALASATSVNYAKGLAGSAHITYFLTCGAIETNKALLADIPSGTPTYTIRPAGECLPLMVFRPRAQ
jgi:hypothetical protein